MKSYSTEKIRNVALVGHGGSGKTTLSEHLLYTAGHIDRIGTVEAGNTVADFDQEEVRRKISLNTALLPIEWQGYKINLLDVPGFPDFIGEMVSSLRVVETAVLVTPAQEELEVGFENAWEFCETYSLPRFLFVNKMERDNADYAGLLQTLNRLYGRMVLPLQIPIGSQLQFKGVVDLLRMKAYYGSDRETQVGEVPAEWVSEAKSAREALIEAAAEAEDDLTLKYLEGESLTEEEILRGLRTAIRMQKVVPLLVGAAQVGIGVRPLLEAIVELAPAPHEMPPVLAEAGHNGKKVEIRCSTEAPLSAFVFKTTADPYVGKLTFFRVYSGVFHADSQVYNPVKEREERIGQLYFIRGKQQEATSQILAGDLGATAKLQETGTNDTLCERGTSCHLAPIRFPEAIYTVAIVPKSKADEDRLGPALARLQEEDPTFHTQRSAETGQTLLMGMGDLHLEVLVEKLKRKFGTEVQIEEVRIPYRETIRQPAKAQGKYKRQTGGRGQYGDCWIELEPLPRGSGIEFGERIVGGVIPKNYIPSIEKGLREAAEKGLLAGYPVTDFRAVVYDGSYHEVDSSDQAFRIAGSLAFQNAAQQANLVLLEPILELEVDVPEGFTGDVIGDLNGRRGRILGMEPLGKGRQLIRALVPMAEVLKYALDLRSITRGRGRFQTRFAHYEEVPFNLAQSLIEKAKREREAAEH